MAIKRHLNLRALSTASLLGFSFVVSGIQQTPSSFDPDDIEQQPVEASEVQDLLEAETQPKAPEEWPPPSPPPPVQFSPPAPPPRPEIVWLGPIAVCVGRPPSSIPAEVVTEMEQTLQRAANVWNEISNASIIIGFESEEGACLAKREHFSDIIFSGIIMPVAPAPTSSRGNQDTRINLVAFGFNNIVRAKLTEGASQFAATDRLGNGLKEGGVIEFRTQYRWNDRVCGIDGIAGSAQCRFADAVHEFGHLLGFSHDHISSNAPACVNLTMTHEHTDSEMSYYDPDSIMNYCNQERWRGKLSEADICSTQVRYPLASSMQRREYECYALARNAASERSVNSGLQE